MADGIDLIVRDASGNRLDAAPDALRVVRPQAIGVGVVHFQGYVVQADRMAVGEAEIVFDETGEDVFAEDVARRLVAVVLVGPVAVVAMGEVGPFQQVRHPADPAFG